MATATIRGRAASIPQKAAAPLVYLKRTWSGEWELTPDLEVVRVRRATGASGHDDATLRYDYGRAMGPHESDLADRQSRDLLGWWVKTVFVDRGGIESVWVGRIADESRSVAGSDERPTGVQQFVAYGPLHLLSRAAVRGSVWYDADAGADVRLGWCPGFNAALGGRPAGNRSANPYPDQWHGSFLFGASGKRWSRREMVEYVLKQVVEAEDGPTWYLSGDLRVLEAADDAVAVVEGESARDLLARLIDPALGVDFVCDPAAGGGGGWDVRVFSLSVDGASYEGATLPANREEVRLDLPSSREDLAVTVIRSAARRVGTIRVVGERIVVAWSLSYEAGEIEPRWSTTQEVNYQVAAGPYGHSADEHDQVRAAARFADVFCAVGAAAGQVPPCPRLYANGQVRAESSTSPFEAEQGVQAVHRETLRLLPLYEGVDYTTNPPTVHAPDGATRGLVAPLVWLWSTDESTYHEASAAGLGVEVLATDWGVRVKAKPPHRLASTHFSEAGAEPSLVRPDYDYDRTVMTLGVRTDHRLAVEVVLDADDPSVLEIVVPGAELWYVPAGTRVRYDPVATDGGWLTVPRPLVVRNDAATLARVMAGALARYAAERGRAALEFQGFVPAGDLLGRVLRVVETGAGDAQNVAGVVTSALWEAYPSPRTLVSAGYAR